MSRTGDSQRFSARGVRAAVTLSALAALVSGCPSPNIYGTPRTIPAGTIQHTVALEGIGGFTPRASAYAPTLPTYQIQYGLSDRISFGGRISNLTSLGADLKINFVRGAVDLAVDPSFQAFYIAGGSSSTTGSVGIAYLNLPLLVGFNFGRSFTLLLTPGIAGALAFTGTTSSVSGDSATYTGSGFLLRMGVGFNFRLSESIALHPEVTTLWNPDTEGFILSTGIGLSFGSQPDYSDQ